MKLANSVVLITGAAKRVGRHMAEALAESSANLVIHYRHSEKEALSLQRRLIKKHGVKVGLVQGDLTQMKELRQVAAAAWNCFGKVDVLINNASTFYPTPLGTTTEEQWQDLFAINARAPYFLSEILGLKMQKRGRGKIINMVDWAAERPYTQYLPYCASKAALLAVSRGLAKSLAPQVQVNSILPGPVMWPDDLGDEVQQSVLKQTPLAKMGKPQDVASAVKFLIEGNDFMTGTEIHVDGGRHL